MPPSLPLPPPRSSSLAKRLLRRASLVAVVGLLVFTAVSFHFARQFTSPAPRPVAHFGDALPGSTESVRFPARDGVSLAAWFIPANAPTAPRASTLGIARASSASLTAGSRAVILLHGHGSTRRQTLARAALLHREGFAVLLYDARGHGESAGDRVSIGWFETRDLLGALDYVRSRGATEIGLLGISMGAATIALAARDLPLEVRWVVLESMYPTLRDAVDRRFRRTLGLPGWLGASLLIPFAEHRLDVSIDTIAPLHHLAHLRCPTFILHGEQDTHTFPDAARTAHARLTAPKSLWIVPAAAHNDLYGVAKENYERCLLDFIRSTALPPPAASTQ